MVKTNITICIDGELLEDLKRLGINKSEIANEAFKSIIALKHSNIDEQNILIKKQELEMLQKEQIERQAKIRNLNLELSSFEKVQDERELNILKAEAERIQAEKSCILCHLPIENKKLEACISSENNLYAHKSCYQAADSLTINKIITKANESKQNNQEGV